MAWAVAGGSASMIMSGSSTANGSSPTMRRATHTAWPSPCGFIWRT